MKTKWNIARKALLAFLLLGASTGTLCEAATIKLATLVPDGSVWDKELRQMGSEWQKLTDGRVRLRVYPGGVAGDEPDVVRKMRIGQLQAATLTVSGLADIDEAFTIFEIPMFYRSYDELFAVLSELTPMLKKRLDDKGFVLLNWGHAGWVHLFTKKPVKVPTDLKSLKLFVWAGDNPMVQWWKKGGYRPVPLAATDIMTGLQTGMIEVLPTTPLIALSLQWYRLTPYMLDLGLAPLVGGTVVTKKAWQRLSDEDRAAISSSSREVEKRLQKAIPDQDRRAIEAMVERGMTVTESGGEGGREIWESAAAEFESTMRGLMVPEEHFDRALKARNAYRRSHGGEEAP